LLTITPKTIYKTFKKHVVDKYQAEIEAGDINFFMYYIFLLFLQFYCKIKVMV
jgi:hypothetical protein